MNIEFFIYLADVLPGLGCFLSVTGTIGLIVFSIVTFICSRALIEDDQFNISELKKIKLHYIFTVIFLSLFIGAFIPSQKTMYLMLGSSYLKNSTIPTKVEQVLNKKLDEFLHDDEGIK